MNIRHKTLLVIAFSLLVSALGNWLVLQQLAYPTFASLEEKSALQNTQRALEAISSEVENISTTLWDYSNWDDAYEFARGSNLHFAQENLNAENLSKFSIDLVEVYDTSDKLIFDSLINMQKPKPQFLLSSISPQLLVGDDEGGGLKKQGVLSTPDGIVMFAVGPVLRTNGDGPPTGLFIFARYLDKALIGQINRRTKINFDLLDLANAVGPDGTNLVAQMIKSETPLVLEDTQNERLLTYSLLNDYLGQPVLVVRSTTGRDISASGRRVLLVSMAGIAVSGLLVMGAAGLLLQWLLIGPLIKFTQQVVAIGRNGNLDQRVTLDRNDEIGILSREFGKMLERLAEARDQSLERSFNTGLAEMAAGVLHNLRNHMTPLSMRVGRLHENLARSTGSKLTLAYEELIKGIPNGERKAKLRKYVELSLRDISVRNEKLILWLERVSDDLRHLDEALSELDRFGRSSNQLTPMLLSKVLQESISQLPEFPDFNVKITIDPRLDGNLAVLSTPFILKHILHNLFVNACEAIVAAGRKEGHIEVVQVMEATDGGTMVDLQVCDNGIGIAADHLNTIFARGFTTKIGERRGTGLHWCANSVAKMGGKLFAVSPGIDCGSVFHLLLPLAEIEMQAAA